jgi:hypothetical protein
MQRVNKGAVCFYAYPRQYSNSLSLDPGRQTKGYPAIIGKSVSNILMDNTKNILLYPAKWSSLMVHYMLFCKCIQRPDRNLR